MTKSKKASRDDIDRYRKNYLSEKDGALMYRALAEQEPDETRAAVFEKLAKAEERHATRWADLLKSAGESVPDHRPAPRTRLLGWLARRFGSERVLPIVTGLEARDQEHYTGQPEAAGLPAEERSHGRALRALDSTGEPSERILEREGWHRRGQSGSLRAAVFGVNDGLVSNFSLVMGVAGAAVGSDIVTLSGVAGMLAGAFSMAAGEYVSMKAQKEMFERQIELEKEELEMSPEEEEEELSLIYQAKGIPEDEAAQLAARIIGDPKSALDTLVREELGLDPTELGSPMGAAGSSFVAFTAGAIIPLMPYLLGLAPHPAMWSAAVSAVALFGVGAAVSVFTAGSVFRSGARMLIIGLLAAAATFGIGRLLGVSVAG